MKESCGAILYTFNPNYSNRLEIILGWEGYHWLPFKGSKHQNELLEDTAIREIYEETGGLLSIDNIKLDHVFSTKRKKYHIGLCYSPYNLIESFTHKRKKEERHEYKEKIALRSFDLLEVMSNNDVHYITKKSIKFYWDQLIKINSYIFANGNVLL